MARTRKLKVYRTPIGFHDAYVAAPSQKAALKAWGSTRDLFARGVAELVEDKELSREPLANPGKVIRRSRGTAAEQIAALPKARPAKRSNHTKPSEKPTRKAEPKAAPKAKSQPRPDRTPVEEARKAVDDLRARHALEQRELRRRQAELDRHRTALDKRQARELGKLNRDAERAQARYDKALAWWRG